ncbi:hypothetical protein QTO34_006693 [Cnephaeus nilssonii]|uniref:Striatin n=1 Tax=Cnephaeus nilssonii TaxID=3371016 RepID=A0AA40HM50_CNENI|nr:hypothetical protein QTO34_006693 [Eptesicus nilssonii]
MAWSLRPHQPPRSVRFIANNKDALRKTWNPKFTLRSHFDGIRALAFHPIEPVLITASEDHTLKMWNLQKTAPAKKGPVLCVVMSSNGEQCYSGGTDGLIQGWNTTNPNIDPYDSYDPSVLRGPLLGHTDAVWGLAYSAAHQRLLSCSADGTLRLWNTTEVAPALSVFNDNQEFGIPASVDLVSSDPSLMVASFSKGYTSIFNMETQQRILTLESNLDTTANSSCQINRVISHPTLPISITAHEDRHIKFYDNNTGKLIHSMVAHLEAVTSLAVDPNGLYLMSGSHDCSIRLWNLESKTCIQEFTAHRKKFEESIHDVAFHPSKCYIASAGADALAKVFVFQGAPEQGSPRLRSPAHKADTSRRLVRTQRPRHLGKQSCLRLGSWLLTQTRILQPLGTENCYHSFRQTNNKNPDFPADFRESKSLSPSSQALIAP